MGEGNRLPTPSARVDCDVFRCYIAFLVASKWRISNPGTNQHHRADTHGITDACTNAHNSGTGEGPANARRSSLVAQEEGTFPDETDVSTVKHFPQTQTGLPSADGHPVWAGHHQQAPTERAQTAVRLSGGTGVSTMADRGPVNRRSSAQDGFPLRCTSGGSAPEQTAPTEPITTRPFAKSARLRTRSQFQYVKTNGPRCAGRHCVVSIASPADGRRRFAIITSRRYSKRAVDRNRARRLLRETYRLLLPRMQPVWVVFIPRRAMFGAGLGDVLPEVESSLTRLGVLDRTDAGPGTDVVQGGRP